jgi:hypothetical protein
MVAGFLPVNRFFTGKFIGKKKGGFATLSNTCTWQFLGKKTGLGSRKQG